MTRLYPAMLIKFRSNATKVRRRKYSRRIGCARVTSICPICALELTQVLPRDLNGGSVLRRLFLFHRIFFRFKYRSEGFLYSEITHNKLFSSQATVKASFRFCAIRNRAIQLQEEDQQRSESSVGNKEERYTLLRLQGGMRGLR